jgi:hypothetical protein
LLGRRHRHRDFVRFPIIPNINTILTLNSLLPHNTPSAPASHAVTGPAPYPTVVVPSAPAGTGYPAAPPAGTGAAQPSGTAAPSGTGAYSAPPSQFTGAASSIKVGGALAAGAFAALFL